MAKNCSMSTRLNSVIDQHNDRGEKAMQELGINHTREFEGRHSLFVGTGPLFLMGGVPPVFLADACDVPVVQHVYKFGYKKGTRSMLDKDKDG